MQKPAIFSPLWVAVSIYPKSFLECMRKEALLPPSSSYACFTPKWRGGPQGGMAPGAHVERQQGGDRSCDPSRPSPGPACPLRPSAGPAWTRRLTSLPVPPSSEPPRPSVGAHNTWAAWPTGFIGGKLSPEPRCAAASSRLAPSPSDIGRRRRAPTARSGIGSPKSLNSSLGVSAELPRSPRGGQRHPRLRPRLHCSCIRAGPRRASRVSPQGRGQVKWERTQPCVLRLPREINF